MKVNNTGAPKRAAIFLMLISLTVLFLPLVCYGQNSQAKELYYYVSGDKVFVDHVPGEYFVQLATESQIKSLESKKDSILFEVPLSSLYKLNFLPDSSPYRVVRNIVPKALTRSKQEDFKLSQNHAAVLWQTPVVKVRGSEDKLYPLNRILVRFKASATQEEISTLLEQYPLRDTKTSSKRPGRFVFEVNGPVWDNVFHLKMYL